MPKTWFTIKAAATGDAPAGADVSIYDEIGYWGVTAKDFIDSIKPYKGQPLNVAINSPGGDVFAGIAIYNALRQHAASGGKVTTKAMGVAASAASVVFMAGDNRVMPDNTMLMVHNPWTFAMGNADELRESADVLDKIGASLTSIYTARSGKSEDEIRAMLATDTWLTAAEAKDAGFTDELQPAFEAQALFDLDRLPANVRGMFEARKPEPAPVAPNPLTDTVAALAKAAGLEEFTPVFVTDASLVDEASAQSIVAQARDIQALAKHAGLAEQAPSLIRERKSLTEARAFLAKALADASDATHVNTAPPSNQTKPADAGPSSTSIWADIKAMKAGSKK